MAKSRAKPPSVSEMVAYTREQARARNADPNIAVKVGKSEGMQKGVWQSNVYKNGRRETSYGPFQLLVGGGLGDKFIKQTGLDPADPSTWKEQIQFALDEAIQDGWGAWYGAAKVGVGKWDGLSGAQPLGISQATETAAAETPEMAGGLGALFSGDWVEPMLAANQDRIGSRIESAFAPGAAPSMASDVLERLASPPGEPNPARFDGTPAPMMGAPTGLPEPIQARFDGAPPPMLGNPTGLREPNPARFEGTPAPMLGAPTGLPEPNPARFEGTPFPSPNRTGMQPFGGVPTPGLTPISLAWDPRGLGSVAPTPVQTSAFGLPPSGQMVPANNFGLAHGQPGFAGGVPAREVSALFKVDGPGPRDGAFTQDAYRNPQNFEFAPSTELAAPADARFSGPAAPKGDRLLNALPSREMAAMGGGAIPGAIPRDSAQFGAGMSPADIDRTRSGIAQYGEARKVGSMMQYAPGTGPAAEWAARSKPAAQPAKALDASSLTHAAGVLDNALGPLGNNIMRVVGAVRSPSSASTVGSRADDSLPEIAKPGRQTAPRGKDYFPAAPARGPVRLVNPISVGQPGGKSGPGQTYGGTGLAAMMGVRSGMSPVGTVARSASNPDVMNVSLPHGNVAHINQAKGYISTWSPADDDERGTVYGKTLAIDPTGTKSSYVSPAKAQELASKGWTTYGPNTAPGPGKGVAKSTAGPAGSGQRGGLLGMLSGMFGQQGRGPGFSGLGIGRGGVLGLPGPLGLAAGMFGPAGGMGGLGLGGGMSGGGGFGGYGNPGFGGAISSNNNYGGL